MDAKKVSERSPSLAALARAHNKLHECVDGRFNEAKTQREDIAKNVSALKDDVAEIKEALGLGEKKRPTMATQGAWRASLQQAIALLTTGGALIAVYRIIVSAWPSVLDFLVQFNAALLKG